MKTISSLCLLSALLMNGANAADCISLDVFDDNVEGCYGTFSAGVISDAASNLCDTDYHVCNSANEAEVLGLTTDKCNDTVPDGHSFWSLESSNGNSECYSVYGEVTDPTPSNDVWGCARDNLYSLIDGCSTASCGGALNIACSEAGNSASSAAYGFQFCGVVSGCDLIELFVMETTAATAGSNQTGVLCCKDDPVTLPTQTCGTESLRVLEISDGTGNDFSPYVGTYTYSQVADGSPQFTNANSGARFYVTTYLTATPLLVGFDIPNYQSYRTGSTDGNTVTKTTSNTYIIPEDLFNIDNGGTTFYTQGIPITVKAEILDCPNYGFEEGSSAPTNSPTNVPTDAPTSVPTPEPTGPTLNPTPAPTNDPTTTPTDNPTSPPTAAPTDDPTPSPTQAPTNSPTDDPTDNGIGPQCSNYNSTTYSSCAGDANCANCQPWGCAVCEDGYYKMGNFMRCQSCQGNYPGCSFDGCSDWNGCDHCQTGTRDWVTACNDHICV